MFCDNCPARTVSEGDRRTQPNDGNGDIICVTGHRPQSTPEAVGIHHVRHQRTRRLVWVGACPPIQHAGCEDESAERETRPRGKAPLLRFVHPRAGEEGGRMEPVQRPLCWPHSTAVDFGTRLFAAMAGGGAAAVISCPAEVTLVRMSNDKSLPVDQRRNYKGVVDAALRIAREEGLPAFWRGSAPFMGRAMLVGGTQVATYDQFKELYVSMGVPKGLPTVFSAAMSAGLIYSLITMPLESAKNRMAFQKRDSSGVLPYRGTFQTVAKVARAEGVMALWSGFLPYYGRCGGHTVTMFICMEQLRLLCQLLDIH